MYFSERKCIDDTIYKYFKDMPNKQDVIKMILYKYVTSKNAALDNFVTKTTKKVCKNNTNSTRKSQDIVTKTTHKDVTENAPISEKVVTYNAQEEHKKESKSTQTGDKFNADDLITEEKVENKDTNSSEIDLKAIWESQNRFMNK